MNPEPCFVFDTNVTVSSFLQTLGHPARARDFASVAGTLLVSDATLAELRDVMERPRFDRFIAWEKRLHLVDKYARESTLIEIADAITACRDPKDDKFLELAVSGRAACLVSGDADLLVLHPFRGFPILTPQQFVEQFVQSSE